MSAQLRDPSRRLVAGNWKMNLTRQSAEGLAREVADGLADPALGSIDVAVCPSGPLLWPAIQAAAAASGGARLLFGGQDCSPQPAGAHTGDQSAAMLASLGCRLVIVGHSERRHGHGETSAQVKAKAQQALATGLVPVICVGELLAERDGGQTLAIVGAQVEDSLPDDSSPESVVLAYEPVWAIGTGRVPAVADVAEVHAAIGAALARRGAGPWRVLYGGSVTAANAAELMAVPGVAGALVGGASLKAREFLSIAVAASRA